MHDVLEKKVCLLLEQTDIGGREKGGGGGGGYKYSFSSLNVVQIQISQIPFPVADQSVANPFVITGKIQKVARTR